MNSIRFGALYKLSFRNVGTTPPQNMEIAQDHAAFQAAAIRSAELKATGFGEPGNLNELPEDVQPYFEKRARMMQDPADDTYYLVDGAEWDYLKAMYRTALQTLPTLLQEDALDDRRRHALLHASVQGLGAALLERYKALDLLAGEMTVAYAINPEVSPTDARYLSVKKLEMTG